MKINHFTLLRLVTGLALLALLTRRIMTNGPTINLVLFLILVALWFLPTLLLNVLHKQTPRAALLSNTLCAVLDAYVLLMATAEAASSMWSNPFLLLGGYVFLVAILGGTIASIGSAISGYCGLLNGWLQPSGGMQLSFLLSGGIVALSGVICGTAWRLILPIIVRLAQQQQKQAQAASTPPTTTEHPKQAMLANMQNRLQAITAERDHAQEMLRQIEAQQPVAATEPPPKDKPPVNSAPLSPEAYIQQMEAELANIQVEKTAIAKEKQNIQAEISKLSDELMAAFLPP